MSKWMEKQEENRVEDAKATMSQSTRTSFLWLMKAIPEFKCPSVCLTFIFLFSKAFSFSRSSGLCNNPVSTCQWAYWTKALVPEWRVLVPSNHGPTCNSTKEAEISWLTWLLRPSALGQKREPQLKYKAGSDQATCTTCTHYHTHHTQTQNKIFKFDIIIVLCVGMNS